MNSDAERVRKNFEIVCGNTINIYLKDLLANNPKVIGDVKEILNSFNRECVSVLNWGLFEIPLEGNYRFLNWKTGEHLAFANYFSEEKSFLPMYVDEHSNEQVASTLKEAIEMEYKNDPK
ncbi:hypothetical protein P7D43_20715 [Enterococcus avium]|uniref:Uncharacterized protein n=1 Tax=Enterococcus avium TaxID=33945 RepID=A0AAW8S2Z6_ENTAV|nr:hypothetical protein [Enterococcus avium]MDT2391722.1 hypothetical protein [Enterococcus avium]MDT2404796.1 hypothetical protein [Enterococcus avium]MDT2437869.1 hypothetical protein [Enterococcus avium]